MLARIFGFVVFRGPKGLQQGSCRRSVANVYSETPSTSARFPHSPFMQICRLSLRTPCVAAHQLAMQRFETPGSSNVSLTFNSLAMNTSFHCGKRNSPKPVALFKPLNEPAVLAALQCRPLEFCTQRAAAEDG